MSQCDVCRDCDCTRFHLEFQEELWKEMSEQEANARVSMGCLHARGFLWSSCPSHNLRSDVKRCRWVQGVRDRYDRLPYPDMLRL